MASHNCQECPDRQPRIRRHLSQENKTTDDQPSAPALSERPIPREATSADFEGFKQLFATNEILMELYEDAEDDQGKALFGIGQNYVETTMQSELDCWGSCAGKYSAEGSRLWIIEQHGAAMGCCDAAAVVTIAVSLFNYALLSLYPLVSGCFSSLPLARGVPSLCIGHCRCAWPLHWSLSVCLASALVTASVPSLCIGHCQCA